MIDEGKAAREMTHDEWADALLSKDLPREHLASALMAAEARGRMHERCECAALAREHANTITEEMVGALHVGKYLSADERIELASTMRHVAQYVGALISQRSGKPPRPIGHPA